MKEIYGIVTALLVFIMIAVISNNGSNGSDSEIPISSSKWTEVKIEKNKNFTLDLVEGDRNLTWCIRKNTMKSQTIFVPDQSGQMPQLGYGVERLYFCLAKGQREKQATLIFKYR